MKKLLLFIPMILLTMGAKKNDFTFDSSKLLSDKSTDKFANSFNQSYNLKEVSEKNKDSKLIELTKKATYLLLGKPNNTDETEEEYFSRYMDYLDLRYAPDIPKNPNTITGLDENSEEYKDDLVSGMTVPSVFKMIAESGIIYNTYGNININETNKYVIASIVLPNIKYKEIDDNNPTEYIIKKSNLVINYVFKKLNGEYKLYSLNAATSDDLEKYLNEIENNETKNSLSIASSNNSNLKDIYDFSRLEAVSEDKINEIYSKNRNNTVYLNAYYSNSIVASGNGFFINNGLIITSFSFLKEALERGQFITINSEDKIYNVDGIVTTSSDSDIAIIKLKEKTENKVSLSNNVINVEDPVFILDSKTGISHTIDSGIILSNDGLIQTSISLQKSDAGSMVLDLDGNVIGIIRSDGINMNVSYANSVNVLKEVQDKFSNMEFEKIESISFKDLKEKYFYNTQNKETINKTIPKDKWKEFSNIGKIDSSIQMKLVKSSINKNKVSMRYKNEISAYLDSMDLATQFKNNLKSEGFITEFESNSKCIYKSKKYEVVVMKEFDYLIVVMVKLW